MPIYEYYCKNCNLPFEELVASSETKVSCPTCSNKDVDKQLSTFGVSMGSSLPTLPCGDGACGMPGPGCPSGGCPGQMN